MESVFIECTTRDRKIFCTRWYDFLSCGKLKLNTIVKMEIGTKDTFHFIIENYGMAYGQIQTYTHMIVVVDGGGGSGSGGGNSTNTANSGEKKSVAKNLSGIALSIIWFYHTKQPWKHKNTHINALFHCLFRLFIISFCSFMLFRCWFLMSTKTPSHYIQCIMKNLDCMGISVTKSDKIMMIDIWTMWVFSTKCI